MPGDDGTVPEPVGHINAWVLTRLPYVNQDILARRRPPGDLGVELTRSVLADLPRPEMLTVVQAQQLVVLLGLAGASMARHYQEQSPLTGQRLNVPSTSARPGTRQYRSAPISGGWPIGRATGTVTGTATPR
jgi:hypothetical protein